MGNFIASIFLFCLFKFVAFVVLLMFPKRFPCALMMLVFSNVFNEEEDEEHCNQNGGLIIITTLLFLRFVAVQVTIKTLMTSTWPVQVQSFGTGSRSSRVIFVFPTFRCRNMKRGPLVVIAAIWTLPCHQLFHLKTAILWRKCPNIKTIQQHSTSSKNHRSYHSASPGG